MNDPHDPIAFFRAWLIGMALSGILWYALACLV